MHIEVTRDVIERIEAQARSAQPAECCGILLGEGVQIDAIQPVANVHPTAETHFEIDPQALIDAHRRAREGGPEVIGYYHSHPAGEARPSRTDEESAAGDGAIWAIAAPDEITFWRSEKDGFTQLSYDLIEI